VERRPEEGYPDHADVVEIDEMRWKGLVEWRVWRCEISLMHVIKL
jgi:hypothetical protein